MPGAARSATPCIACRRSARSQPGLWIASGFGGHGLNTTAMAGNLIARAIVEGSKAWRHFEPFEMVWAGGPFGRAAAKLGYLAYTAKESVTARLARRQERLRGRNRSTTKSTPRSCGAGCGIRRRAMQSSCAGRGRRHGGEASEKGAAQAEHGMMPLCGRDAARGGARRLRRAVGFGARLIAETGAGRGRRDRRRARHRARRSRFRSARSASA